MKYKQDYFTLDPEWDDLDPYEWLEIIKAARSGAYGAAEGGRVPFSKGKRVLEGLAKLMDEFFPKTTKLGQTSKPMAPKTELKRSIAGFQEREKAAKTLEAAQALDKRKAELVKKFGNKTATKAEKAELLAIFKATRSSEDVAFAEAFGKSVDKANEGRLIPPGMTAEGVDDAIARGNLQREFPGISDDLINKILTDDNPQRVAEVKATMKEAMKMQEKGMPVEEIINIFKNIKRTKNASGGLAGMRVPYQTGAAVGPAAEPFAEAEKAAAITEARGRSVPFENYYVGTNPTAEQAAFMQEKGAAPLGQGIRAASLLSQPTKLTGPTTRLYSGTTSPTPFAGSKFYATPDKATAMQYMKEGAVKGSPFGKTSAAGKLLQADVPTSQAQALLKKGVSPFTASGATREVVLDPKAAKTLFETGKGTLKGASSLGTKAALAGTKALPIVGGGVTLADAASRLKQGDYVGAGLGAAAAVPGLGLPALGTQMVYDAALKNPYVQKVGTSLGEGIYDLLNPEAAAATPTGDAGGIITDGNIKYRINADGSRTPIGTIGGGQAQTKPTMADVAGPTQGETYADGATTIPGFKRVKNPDSFPGMYNEFMYVGPDGQTYGSETYGAIAAGRYPNIYDPNKQTLAYGGVAGMLGE